MDFFLGGAKQRNSIIGGYHAIQTNPYATLEQVVSTFMNILSHKEQILTNTIAHKQCEIRHYVNNYTLILHQEWCDLNLIRDFVLVGLDNKVL